YLQASRSVLLGNQSLNDKMIFNPLYRRTRLNKVVGLFSAPIFLCLAPNRWRFWVFDLHQSQPFSSLFRGLANATKKAAPTTATTIRSTSRVFILSELHIAL